MDEIEKIIELINPDLEAIKKGKERQSKIWRGIEPDYLPILLTEADVPELNDFVHYTRKEQFFNKEKMLFEELKGLVGVAMAGGDGQLSIRVNFGVGIIPSLFGLTPTFTQDDQMPWYVGNLSKEEIQNLEVPDNIRNMGVMPKIIEYLEYFIETVNNTSIHIRCFDTQGPFDIAHLIRGPKIYTDVYDDPEFVHKLMKISTKAYIETTKIFKEIVKEPLSSGYHGMLYMDGGGVRVCEDSSINLSPHLFREFSLPYVKEALRPFGGGWVHFCGNGNHILDFYLEIEEVKGLNFGNPEMYDYEKVISKIISKGKFCYAIWPKKKNETLKEYFRRLLLPLNGKKGLILELNREKNWPSCKEIIDMWHSLQDSIR